MIGFLHRALCTVEIHDALARLDWDFPERWVEPFDWRREIPEFRWPYGSTPGGSGNHRGSITTKGSLNGIQLPNDKRGDR